jgi:ElaB/YqjD/DUF883 family membrane-anchored ribosome-binding protein
LRLKEKIAMSTTTMDKDYEELRSEIKQLRADLAQVTATMKKVVGDGADVASDRIKAAAAQGRAKAREGAEAVEAQIEEHPFTSVAVSFGVGLLLGRLLSD